MSRGGSVGGRVQVPDELREVLLEFTISYLLEQPGDVVSYAADYFQRLREARCSALLYDGAGPSETLSPDESTLSREDAMCKGNRLNTSYETDESSDYSTASSSDEEEFAGRDCCSSSASGREEPPVGRFQNRRKSVFAETYNPEEDEDDDGTRAIFPKSDDQRQCLSEAVRNILLFRSLEKDQMNEVLDAMFERKVAKDELVIKQGDDGDNFYVIQSGVFHALVQSDSSQEPIHIHTYDNRGSFGELALLYNMPRAATIKANTDGSLWAMNRQTFRRILLKSAFKKRKMYEALIDSVPMLKTLQPYERMNLADALVPRTFSKGDRIIKQGDAADGMYFVEDGQVVISVLDDSGTEIEINRILKGGYFGELALVTHRPRAASAFADGDVKLAFLDVEAFERLLGPCMEIMKRNITDYEDQMLKIFGSKQNIRDMR